MDQLHEECKQPIIEELDDREAETEIHEEHHTSHVIGRQLSMETSSCSSQSDGDYETCDSAIGSERDINHSSDENSDINDVVTKMNLSTRQNRSKNSFCKSEDASDAINRPGYLKVKKDSINMSMRAGDNTSTCSDDQRSDSGDFVDAENEPLRSRRRGGKRTMSDSSDREQANLYSRRQPVQYKQSVSTGNITVIFTQ
jgi:hypothetical protein